MHIGLSCSMRQEFKLRLEMEYVKRCPHCGTRNGLSGYFRELAKWAGAGLQNPTIPICSKCSRPLYKFTGWILKIRDEFAEEMAGQATMEEERDDG